MSKSNAAIEGKCEKCDAPGSLQHAPAPMPSRGVGCERCLGKLEWCMKWWRWTVSDWWIPLAVEAVVRYR